MTIVAERFLSFIGRITHERGSANSVVHSGIDDYARRFRENGRHLAGSELERLGRELLRIEKGSAFSLELFSTVSDFSKHPFGERLDVFQGLRHAGKDFQTLLELAEGSPTKKDEYEKAQAAFMKLVLPLNLDSESLLERSLSSAVRKKAAIFEHFPTRVANDIFLVAATDRIGIRSAGTISIIDYIIAPRIYLQRGCLP